MPNIKQFEQNEKFTPYLFKDELFEGKFLLGDSCKVLNYKISKNGLEWLEDRGEVNADELISQDINTKFENAKNFILGCIASKKEITANELQDLCKIGGFSKRTFDGARSILNKNNKIHQIKKNSRTYWALSSPLDSNVQSCNVESEVNRYE